MGKKLVYTGIGIVVIVALFLMVRPGVTGYAALENYEGKVEFHKSSSCGCCGAHSNYLSRKGNLDLKMMVMDDVEPIKNEYNIPNELRTCHTAIIAGYFVEGHVPLEAINRLVEEQPDIAGIALPGMPAGSPGMPGVKNSDWVIYGVNHDGSSFEWMVI
jgi:hypothetical protein